MTDQQSNNSRRQVNPDQRAPNPIIPIAIGLIIIIIFIIAIFIAVSPALAP